MTVFFTFPVYCEQLESQREGQNENLAPIVEFHGGGNFRAKTKVEKAAGGH
jgi:hypothetical protein